MSSEQGLSDLLKALARVMPAWADRWYLFGAQAVQVWGMPRLTGDVDVTAELRDRDHPDFVSAMRKEGFDLRVRDIGDFVKKTRVFPFVHRHSRIPLDIVLAGPGLEEEFLKRALPVEVGGAVVPVISPEDLIVTKLLAGRPKDIEDVRGILRERARRLDVKRIRRTLRLLGKAIAQTNLTQIFNSELAALKSKSSRKTNRRPAAKRRPTRH
ncbi:MAG TPA: nucleotidyl transferase AbiEii/AbiGii toxin family protein [Thermoanaerobaculia bacterium]|nr:nucleotidyl transferase AbiEii/AbiGii toxin family protein [Thermoanaerobaculia bacterium]